MVPEPTSDTGRRPAAQPAGKADAGGTPWWALRFWIGFTWRAWWPLWRRHNFHVSPSRLPFVVGVVLTGAVTGAMAGLQSLRFSRAVAREPLPPPVFVIGHWRSGTTYAHELLATGGDFLTPAYLECFATDHFLQWGGVLRWLRFLLPDRRPMDNVKVGFDRPQEDEFALLMTGAPSPYETMLFPNDRGEALAHLDIDAEPEPDRRRWRRAMRTMMQRVAFARRRKQRSDRLAERAFLLKSPTHTARIRLLREMFPDAKFIHVVRNPLELFPSTVKMWRDMGRSQGFQKPDFDLGDEAFGAFVNASMRELYRHFDRDVAALGEGDFVETRYEDLVRDPIGEVGRIRQVLGFGDADADALQALLGEVGEYRPNRHRLDAATEAMIQREWRWYFDRFGYGR